jgi:hypothetical protein
MLNELKKVESSGTSLAPPVILGLQPWSQNQWLLGNQPDSLEIDGSTQLYAELGMVS